MIVGSRARWLENGDGLAWRFFLFLLAILLLGGACASDEQEPAVKSQEKPRFEVSKAVLDFGTIPTGSEKALRFEVTNVFSAPLALNLGFEGTDVSFFEACLVKGDGPCAETWDLEADGSVEVEVSYVASESGIREATLIISDGGDPRGEVTLQGKSQRTGPTLECEPTSLDLGDSVIGGAKLDFFDCVNAGFYVEGYEADPLMIDAISSSNPRFEVSVLNVDDSTEIKEKGYGEAEGFRIIVAFAPEEEGLEEGVVEVESTAVPGGVLELGVQGRGEEPCIGTDEFTLSEPEETLAFPKRFVLRKVPQDQNADGEVNVHDIELTFDDVPVPPIDEGKPQWFYDPVSNAIDFPPLGTPSAGTVVEATYAYRCE